MVQSNLDPTAWIVESGLAYSTLSAAHTAASAKDTILLSEGIFTGITITKELRLVGQGVGKTIVTGPLRPQTNSSFLLEHLTVKSTGSNIGLYLDEVTNVYLNDVVVEAASAQAIYVEGVTALELEKVRTLFGTNGIYIDDQGTPELLGVHFRDVKIIGASSDGLLISKINDEDGMILFEKLCIQGCSGHALSVLDITFQRLRLYIRDSIFNNCVVSGKAGINIDGCDHVEVYDCDVFRNDIGLQFGTTAPTSYKIEGNRIHDNNTTNVDNDIGSAVNLLYNWWGASPPPSAWAGTVNVEPWLESPYSSTHNAIEMDYLLRTEIGESVTDGLNTTSVFETDLSSTDDNYYNNMMIKFISGNNIGQARRITDYVQATKFISVSEAFDTIPVTGEKFILISLVAGAGSSFTEAGIADAVWDELKSGHVGATTFGDLGNKVDQQLTTMETDIRGADGDDLKDISDEIAIHDGNLASVEASQSTHRSDQGTHRTAMGSHETAQATSRGIISTNLDQVLSTTESNIRGADSDDLKNLSDQLDAIEPEINIEIEHPSQIMIPDGIGVLDAEFTSSSTSLTLEDASTLPDSGYFIAESEWCHYASKSVNTLSSITRALFGTADVTHAVGVTIYQAIPLKTVITIHDAGVPLAPNSVPTIAIEDMHGTSIVAATAMTQEGAKVGIYEYEFLLGSNQAFPAAWVLKYVVEALAGKTNEYRRVSLLMGEPSTQADILGNVSAIGDLRYADQDGYLSGLGVWTPWTDDFVGAFKDADGDFVYRGLVTWQHIVSGDIKKQVNPPASVLTNGSGEWAVYVVSGTYNVHFWKDRIKDEDVERTVT